MSRKGRLIRNLLLLIGIGVLCCLYFGVYPSARLAARITAYQHHIVDYEIVAETDEHIRMTKDTTGRGGWWIVPEKADARYFLIENHNVLMMIRMERKGFLWSCTWTEPVEADPESAVLSGYTSWKDDFSDIILFGKVQSAEVAEVDAVFEIQTLGSSYSMNPIWSSAEEAGEQVYSKSPYFLRVRRYDSDDLDVHTDFAGFLPLRRAENGYEILFEETNDRVKWLFNWEDDP